MARGGAPSASSGSLPERWDETGGLAVGERSGIWAELRKQRLSIPLVSIVVGSFLLFTLLTDPVIDFTKPQSPGIWPRAMIVGLLLIGAVMLFWGVYDTWQERRERRQKNDRSLPDHALEDNDSAIMTQEQADIIASGGAVDVEHDNRKMVIGILGIFGYGVAVGYIGFTLATMAIIAYWLLIWGVRSPLRIVLTSGIGTGSILVIFVKVGYLALPKGVGPFHEFTIWLFRTLHLF
jgi:hypothetical protein